MKIQFPNDIPPMIIKACGQVVYESQPKQSQFHWAVQNRGVLGVNDFFTGGSSGGGKSYMLRWQSHSSLLSIPKLRGLLLRSSFPELERTHISKVNFDFPSGVLKYNENKKTATYYNGSVLEFGYGERQKDFEQYLSAEYDFIVVDELTTIPFELVILLKTRIRTSTPGWIPYFASGSNPGSTGHRYVKSYYIDEDFDVEFPDLTSQYDPSKILFIPASVYDNPRLLATDPTYLDKLRALPPFQRKRFLDGSWDIKENQFFDFSREVHVVSNFQKIPEGWRVIASMDYGNVSIAHLITQDPDTRIYYVVDEWMEKNKSATEKATSYFKWLREKNLLNIITVGDTNMFAKSKEFGGDFKPSVEYFRTLGLNFRPVSKKSENVRKFRVYCNDFIKDLLNYKKDENGLFILRPNLYICERCKELIKTMPDLPTDHNNERDFADPNGIDHAVDSMKMGLISYQNMPKEMDEITKSEIKLLLAQNRTVL